jgi:Uma2 family endonuclease
MATITPARATIDDLYNTEGKAELIGGRIVEYMATGDAPGFIALEIVVSLRDWSRREKRGIARGDNVGFTVPELASGRESFCPDASYYDGPRDTNRMKFIPGPPTLAVEVRSEGDYGPAAEREMAAKRADYFEAGTKVVWDVDTVNEVIHVYRSDRPDTPTTYSRGQTAEAEPAVPGWRAAVDDLFQTNESR